MLERARLLESQNEHEEWMTLKLNTVPYAFAEGNAKLEAKKVFSNTEAYQFFRETECESTCWTVTERNSTTGTDYLSYTCTKHVNSLNMDIYGLHSNIMCNYFTYDKWCREADRSSQLNEEDAYKAIAQIVTQSRWTWFYLATHDGYLSEYITTRHSTDEIYKYLTTELSSSWFESLGWFDIHDSAAGLELAKKMATDICDSRCSLQMASSSGEVHIDDSCVHTLNGILYPVVYNHQLCPYVKSYVDCSTSIDNGLDGTMIVIILASTVVVLLIAILACVHCRRKRKTPSYVSEYSSSSSSSHKEEHI